NRTAFGRIVSSAAVTTIGGMQVVLFGGGATLYVLDAATGRELTSICLDPRADPAVRCKGSDHDVEIESSPAVVRVGGEPRAVDVAAGRVFFGTSSCDVDGGMGWESMWGVSLAGDPVWSFHPPRPSSHDDDDFGASPNVLPGGLVGEGSKDGWYYAVPERA